jgi:exopolyphosphatase/guanosine-5'-triphosphate,3'-diphosphate pyrophosphatase
VEACRRHVRDALAPYQREVRTVGFDVAVASSGTAEAVVALVDRARDDAPPPRTFNGFEVTRKEVKQVVKTLAALPTVEARKALPGVESSRADILLAGAVILEQTMGELKIDRFVFSDYALREGALLDALQRRRGATLHHLHDLRRRSVLRLADVLDEDPGHSSNVAALALGLFDALRPWHDRDDNDRELLEAAALLCNIGLAVGHSGHHKHSYYLIRNAEHLTGFTDHEIEVIALVARYHRKSEPKASHVEFAALRPEDQDRVRALAGLLRVAIPLDRHRGGEVRSVSATPAGGKRDGVVVVVEPRDGADLSLELYSATERKDLLEQVLGVPVRFEAGAAADDPERAGVA